MPEAPDLPLLSDKARLLRSHTLQMIHTARASHIGSCFSVAEILACLYWSTLRINPADPSFAQRDRFILSKGHAAAILYATLAERGFFPVAELNDYCRDGSRLTGHATSGVPGVEISTGSLGHGLPIGCGLALAAQSDGKPWRTFVLLSDGELDEGSNWEAFLFAPHHKLDNLTVIIDSNKIQSFGRVEDVLALAPLAEKLRAFQWHVIEIDGNDIAQVATSLSTLPAVPGKPTVIIANTVKGKGISFMEDDLLWHYRSPSQEQLALALKELEAN